MEETRLEKREGTRKLKLSEGMRWHLSRGEWFCTRDPLWRPRGPRGERLVRLMKLRIDQQVADMDPPTLRALHRLAAGMSQAQAEAVIEPKLAIRYGAQLTYGAVRRLAERVRQASPPREALEPPALSVVEAARQ